MNRLQRWMNRHLPQKPPEGARWPMWRLIIVFPIHVWMSPLVDHLLNRYGAGRVDFRTRTVTIRGVTMTEEFLADIADFHRRPCVEPKEER
jgi:hypothetical protein